MLAGAEVAEVVEEMEEDWSRYIGHALYSRCAALTLLTLFGRNIDSLRERCRLFSAMRWKW